MFSNYSTRRPVREKAAAWYVNVLGFELEKPIDSQSKIAFLHLPERGAAVHLIQTDVRIDTDNYIIGFYCESIKELHAKLIDSGSVATLEDADGCGWWLHFSDIDGNKYFAAEDKET